MSPYKNTNDEMFGMFFKKKVPREHCKSYWSWFLKQSPVDLRSANAEAELLFKKFGITFTMHATDDTSEKAEIDRPKKQTKKFVHQNMNLTHLARSC